MNHALVKDYNAGMPMMEMVKKYRTSNQKIKNRLCSEGIVYKDARFRFEGYNSSAFCDLDEEAAAYFYGFILGDGCLHERGNTKSVVMGVSSRDIDILVKLKNYLGSRNKITTRDVTVKGTVHQTSQFSFCDKEVVERLVSLGLVPRKSCKESVPCELENNRHFWRGLIDADGSLQLRLGKENTFTLSLVGSLEVTSKFKEFCDKTVNSTTRVSKHNANPDAGVYYATLSGQKARDLCSLLYDNCSNYLTRKFNTAENVKLQTAVLCTRTSNASPLPTRDGKWTMQLGGPNNSTVRLCVFDTETAAIAARDLFIKDFNNERSKHRNKCTD